jgi:hypothetical protein
MANGMDEINQLFADANVVSTSEVAAVFDISEATARAWAEELDVAKVGASYAWTHEDVEALDEESRRLTRRRMRKGTMTRMKTSRIGPRHAFIRTFIGPHTAFRLALHC